MHYLTTSIKKLSLIAISALLITTAPVSCKKSDNPIPVTNLGQAINGPAGKLILENSSYNGGSRLESTPQAYINNGYIYINASFRFDQSISLVVAGNSTGNYRLGASQNSSIVYRAEKIYSTLSSGAPSNAGSIVITEIDKSKKTISGTYHFDDNSSSSSYNNSAMNGSFNKIPYSDTPPPRQEAKMELIANNNKLTGKPTATMTSSSFKISCTFTNDANIVMDISGTTPNQYSLGSYSYSNASIKLNGVFYYTEYYSSYEAGTVTITEVNTRNRTISGTFSFYASDKSSYYYNRTTRYISNGKFENVPY